MDNHIYMVYDDSTPESTRDADITHKSLLDKGFRVIHKEATRQAPEAVDLRAVRAAFE